MNMMTRKIIEKIFFVVALILLWQMVYYIGVTVLEWWKPYAIPSPVGVLQVFIRLIKGKMIFIAVGISLKRVIVGFALSILIGSLLGMAITVSTYLNNNLKPLILGLQTLPSICWVPFAILWYGLNEKAIYFVIIIGSTFSVAISIENAIHNINPIYVKAAKTMGARGRDLYLKVIFPASLPELISGLKQGWSFAWRALMAGEVMSASIGLGQVLLMGRDLADINQVMVVMILIVCVGSLIDKCVFSRLEKRVRNKMGLGG